MSTRWKASQFRDRGIKWSHHRWTSGNKLGFTGLGHHEEGWRSSDCPENFILWPCLCFSGDVARLSKGLHSAMEVTWHGCRDIFFVSWWWRGIIVTTYWIREGGNMARLSQHIEFAREVMWHGCCDIFSSLVDDYMTTLSRSLLLWLLYFSRKETPQCFPREFFSLPLYFRCRLEKWTLSFLLCLRSPIIDELWISPFLGS